MRVDRVKERACARVLLFEDVATERAPVEQREDEGRERLPTTNDSIGLE